ncbi:MAG: mechanosensitive ion channel family protein [Coraliomargarita sp.]|nr:mechanosensitive ion channel family protein [Coraliomargarita sp.]
MTADNLLHTQAFAGNEIWRIVVLFFIILVAMVAGKLLKFVLTKRSAELEAQRPIVANGFKGFGKSAPFLIFTVGLYVGASFINLGAAEGFVGTSIAVLFTIAVASASYFLAEVPSMLLQQRAAKTEGKMDDMLVPILSNSMRATIVILAIVQIAQILSGKEITSILAGLGIGGLAVALAAQDTLKNFFGSIVLLADKPFEIGDRINVDGHDGPVESVGLRSTKIRTLDGHLVTIPNGEMANKSIWNIAKRPHIRRIFNVTITYDTPPAKVAEAKAILEDILKDHEGMHEDFLPRVYFNNFNESSLNLFCIYWYHPPAYWDYMAFTERVNTEILERFNAAGIDFAFPTQTVHLAGDPSRPLDLGLPQ